MSSVDKMLDRPGALVAALTAVGALLSVVAAIVNQTTAIHSAVAQANPIVLWIVGAVLVLAVSLALQKLFRQRSKLRDPERLRLDVTEPRHLKGRQEDIDQLLELCERHPLVFLEGESGAGKSAMIQAGVIPACRLRHRLLPVYVDLSGADWRTLPTRWLTDALRKALSESDGNSVTHAAVQRYSGLRALKSTLSSSGLVPLVIFDQFDDYQAAHIGRFRANGVWIEEGELRKRNIYWTGIAALLRRNAIHCLFITRADAAAGLASVRFCPERTYHLSSVRTALIAPILDEFLSDVDSGLLIEHPEAGWHQLKDRLLRDLSRDGRVLPIQLSVCLAGLRNLRYLTPREYEAHGRLSGMERLYIEQSIAEAALAKGISREVVREVLVALTDGSGGKTTPVTLSTLARQILTEGSLLVDAEEKVRALCERLEQSGVVRRRLGVADGEELWLLTHDFLAGGVIAAYRHADRWWQLLVDHQSRFDQSEGLWARWKAMLPISTQILLLWHRARGRVKYQENWRIATASTLRLLQPAAYLALFAISAALIRSDIEHRTAVAIVNSLSEQFGLLDKSTHESKQIQRLARENDRVRRDAVELAFTREFASLARNRLDVLLHLWLGLDPSGQRRFDLYEEIILPALARHPREFALYFNAARAWRIAPGSEPQRQQLLQSMIATVGDFEDMQRTQLAYQVAGLTKLTSFDKQQRTSAARAIMKELMGEDLASPYRLLQPLSMIAAQVELERSQLTKLVQRWTERMAEIQQNDQFLMVAEDLSNLVFVSKTTPEQNAVIGAANAFRTRMRSQEDVREAMRIIRTLFNLAHKVTLPRDVLEDLHSWLEDVLTKCVYDQSCNPSDLYPFGTNHDSGLLDAQIDWFLRRMEKELSIDQTMWLAEALVRHLEIGEVAPERLAKLTRKLASVVESRADFSEIETQEWSDGTKRMMLQSRMRDVLRVSTTLTKLVPYSAVDADNLSKASRAILRMASIAQDTQQLERLLSILGDLAPYSSLDTNEYEVPVGLLLDRMKQARDSGVLAETAIVLGKFAAFDSVAQDKLKEATTILIATLDTWERENEFRSDKFPDYANAMISLARRLGPEEAKGVRNAIVARVGEHKVAAFQLTLVIGWCSLRPGSPRTHDPDAQLMLSILSKTAARPNPSLTPEFREVLVDCMDTQPPADLVQLILPPFAQQNFQTIGLRAIERQVGQTFDDDVWKFVGWASSEAADRFGFVLDAGNEFTGTEELN